MLALTYSFLKYPIGWDEKSSKLKRAFVFMLIFSGNLPANLRNIYLFLDFSRNKVRSNELGY